MTRGRSRSTTVSCASRPGRDDDAATVLRTNRAQLDDLVHDQVTVVGMQTNGSLDQPVGRFDALLDWWLLLRGALDARAPHTRGAIDLVDADGAPLALDRSFAVDASLDEMGDFLQRAGYLHITGVFDEGEMAAVSRDMDAAAPTYSRGDGRSWWAKNRAGDDLLVRMQYFDQVSPAVERLVGDDRLQRLAGLTGDDHVYGSDEGQPHRGAVQAVRRGRGDLRPAVAQGLRARSSQLRLQQHDRRHLGERRRRGVGPAAHRRRFAPRADVAVVARRAPLRPPDVPLPTRTGDLTVHLSCTLHQSVPPVERERRVLYTGFRLPPRGTDAERAALERLRAIREDAPVKAPSANRA